MKRATAAFAWLGGLLATALLAGCTDIGAEPVRDLFVVENTCAVPTDWATAYRPDMSPLPDQPGTSALVLEPLEGGDQMRGGVGTILEDDIVRLDFIWEEAPTYACDGARLGETFSLQCESFSGDDEAPDRCTVQLTPN